MKGKDINQPHLKTPIVSDSVSDKSFLDLKNIKEDSFYQNGEVFPPRGSFINIPEDVLSGTKKDFLDDDKKDSAKENLDLYK